MDSLEKSALRFEQKRDVLKARLAARPDPAERSGGSTERSPGRNTVFVRADFLRDGSATRFR
jgi:hypothetical protein